MGTHYSKAQDPAYMNTWAQRAVEFVRTELDGKAYPLLIYRGMSGISHATYFASTWAREVGAPIGMFYARKPEENSHGGTREYTLPEVCGLPGVLVFIDDFIGSGRTRREVMLKAADYLSGSEEEFEQKYFLQILDASSAEYMTPNFIRQEFSLTWCLNNLASRSDY